MLLVASLSIIPSRASADAGHSHSESDAPHHQMHHDTVEHDAPRPDETNHHEAQEHSNPGHHGDGHHHGSINVSNATLIPSLELAVYDDPMNGWNLHLVTENFDFAPERVNGDSLINEGHAHLYINGEKIMRIYSNWHHLPDLTSGTHEITVTLNANGHEELIDQGEPIADTVVISVP